MITKSLLKAVKNQNLSGFEAEHAMDTIISGEATDIQIGAFIAAMTTKGLTPDEIAAFARAMMNSAVKISPEVDGLLVDTCGTGGDGSGSFNISTASALRSRNSDCKTRQQKCEQPVWFSRCIRETGSEY